MWNAIHSLCHISLNGWVADALAPQGREGGAGRWGKLKPGHLEAWEVCGAAAGRNVNETRWEVFWHLPKRVDDSYPLISVTFAPTGHTSSRIPCHSIIPQGHGHAGSPSCYLCHVVSPLLCNFFPPLLFPGKKSVSRRSTSQCQGAKQLISMSDSCSESQRCLKDSKDSSLCTHNSDATWGNTVDIITKHFLYSPFIWKEHESLFHVRMKNKKRKVQMKLRADWLCKTAALGRLHAGDWKSDDDREDEGARECKRGKERQSQSEKSGGSND